MTVSFYKLQVSGDDFILIDLDRPSHHGLSSREGALGDLAAAILDRRRGVGGRAVLYVGGERGTNPTRASVNLRVFQAGAEEYSGGDALLCAARWAFDSGYASLGKIRMVTPRGERTLTALDSRSFALEIGFPWPAKDAGAPLDQDDGKDARIDLIVDGRAAAAYLLALDRTYAVAVASVDGPGPKRVRTALAELFPTASPVVVRPASRDLVRFVAAEGEDRSSSAAVAVVAATLAGRTESEAAAEWRGRGGAVAFAHFRSAEGSARDAAPPGTGPGALVDRGRFWVEWKGAGRILVVGMAEYSFEGNYDYYLEEG